MQPKPNSRPTSNTLVAVFLLLSASASIAVLANRNLYDDEISSLNTITSPVASILRIIAVSDAHPPGMYLLGHFAFRIIPSFRWMNLFPALVLYAGLAVFLSRITSLLSGTRATICFLLLATLHPQILMWGVTYRWYGWWTGLALITVTIALQLNRHCPSLGSARALVVGLLLAALFYLNFITFLFAFALAASMLLRYWTQRTKLTTPALMTTAVFLAIAAPQFHTMITVHLPNGASQRSSILASWIHLLQALAVSEAYLPWHPLAITAGLTFTALCIFGLIALSQLRSRRAKTDSSPEPIQNQSAIASTLLFGLIFFLLVATTGLGGRPRNALLLVPILALAAALIVQALRPRLQIAILISFALWSTVGVAHLTGRYGLAKASTISHPEEVAQFIRQTSGPDCSVVVTYDAILAFTLNQASQPSTLVVSPFREPILGSTHALPENDCTRVRLYVVQSYAAERLAPAQELQSATHFFSGPPRTDSFSFDPDAARKRSLARIPGLGGDLVSAATLPDYRYVVISGPTSAGQIAAMRMSMPDYISGRPATSEVPLTP